MTLVADPWTVAERNRAVARPRRRATTDDAIGLLAGAGRRAVSWLWCRAPSILLLSCGLAVVTVVHARGMAIYPMRFDDEGSYVSQAWSLLERGALSPYTYWYDHPPAGWMQLAGYLGATGALERADGAVLAAREAMLLAHLLSSTLLFVLCRRLGMARTWCLLAVGLFGLSPLAVTYQRMVLLDNIAMPWLIGSFVLALSPRHRLAAYTGSALCFSMAVLTKQTMALFLPALLYQLWQHTDESNRRYAWSMFASTLVLTLGLYPLWALLKGELLAGEGHVSLVDALEFQLTRDSIDSRSTIRGWLRLDAVAPLAGAAAIVPAAFVRRLRPYALLGATCVAIVLRPGYLPIPFVVAVFLPASVLLAGLVDGLASWRPPGPMPRVLRPVPVVLAVALTAVAAWWVAPRWYDGAQRAMHVDQDAPMRGAEQWVLDHAAPGERLLVDNAMWTELVMAGMPEEQVVWFYKVDLDPVGVGAELSGGVRDFGYLVATQTMRDTAETLPTVAEALDRSVVVATFGSGFDRVEVRQIVPDAPAAAEPSDRAFVVSLYDELLGREPSVAELAGWLQRLDAGELDHDGVVQAIADSPEHVARAGAGG